MLALPKTNLDSYIKYFFGILIIILLTSCSEEKVVGFLEGVGEVTEKQIPEEIIKARS